MLSNATESPPMYVRAVNLHDLDGLLNLACQAPPGLTSLPADGSILTQKITESLSSAVVTNHVEWRRLLLVLIDSVNNHIAGVSGLEREKAYTPHYSLSDHETLQLNTAPISSLKLGSLLLEPGYRGSGNGKLLSKSRFLFMADAEHLLGHQAHAELRGHAEPTGLSHFWKSVGSHLYDRDFAEIDHFRGSQPEDFARRYLAPHEISLALLDHDVKSVIGKVHQDTQNALRILQDEGFTRTAHYDILDAGPIVISESHDILTIKKSSVYLVKLKKTDSANELWLISNRRLNAFRACIAPAHYDDQSLHISREVLQVLQIKPGDTVRALPHRSI